MQMATIISVDKVQEQLEQSCENVIVNATTDDCSIAILVKRNDDFKGYLQLDKQQKQKLLGLKSSTSKKTIRRYDDILLYLQNNQSISQIARRIHLKQKYTKKYIDKLCMLNFIEKNGSCYHTIILLHTGNKVNNE